MIMRAFPTVQMPRSSHLYSGCPLKLQIWKPFSMAAAAAGKQTSKVRRAQKANLIKNQQLSPGECSPK